MMSIRLAENRKACLEISISSGADRVIRFAARELASYLKKMTGADFKIGEEIKGRSIRLVPDGDAELDSFRTSVSEHGIEIRGVNSRSVLYGVYDLLETFGCSFAEPECEIVPEKTELSAEYGSRSETADFKLRNIFRIQIRKSVEPPYDGFEAHHLPQIDWMAKRRLNHYVFYIDYCRYDLWEKHKHQVLDALLDRGFVLEVAHHSIGYFCPKEPEEDFGNFGSETYMANHPDWYENQQVHIEIPEVRELLTKRLIEYARRNPELKMIGLWPSDSGMASPYPGLNQADGYLKFWNQVADRLAEECPGKELSILAYLDLLNPPQIMTGRPNLHVWFCPIRSNYMYPIADPHNHGYLDQLRGWIEKMPPLSVNCFEYYGWKPLLTPFLSKMKQDLDSYHALGVGGIYGWCGFTYNLMGTQYRWSRDLFGLTRLMWNRGCDLNQAEREWAEGVFGEGAPEVLEFYRLLREQHRKECEIGLRDSGPWISMELLRRLMSSLQPARNKSLTEKQRKRLDLLEQLAANGATSAIEREELPGILKAF